MKHTIHRCLKKPGLIDRARTYFVELNDKGLYILAIGKATQVPNARGLVDQAIANAAVNFMEKKFEGEIVENEARIAAGKMDEMAQEKNSYFLPLNQVTLFQSAKDAAGIKITIKGGKANISLIAHVGYATEIQAIVDAIGKR